MEQKNRPVKVLLVNGNSMDLGGIEAFLMNYYRNFDQSKIKCDFIVHGEEDGIYIKEIERLGGKIYHVPIKSKHPYRYQKELKRIFRSENYQIVHSHLDAMNCWVLKIAKNCNIAVRIAHSHNTNHLTDHGLKYFINELARRNVTRYATHLFACSNAAGAWLYGKAWGNDRSQVILNAIDFSLYEFNTERRASLRKEHGLCDEFVIGHIGRFSDQKNHMFLLEFFARIREIHKQVKLVFIGDGENHDRIVTKINDLGITDSILLLGAKSNAYDYYNMMDLFVLPSRFEGLPVAAIEAQVNGLPCFISKAVTREVCLTNQVKLLEIDKIDEWVEEIGNLIQNGHSLRTQAKISPSLAAYHIKEAVKRLESIYRKTQEDVLWQK